MININGLEDINKMIASFNSFLKDEVKQVKITEPFLKDFRKEELTQILNTAGSNIDEPFNDKKTPEWKKYREFSVPTGWYLGIWSGETYYALMTGKSTKNIGIQSTVESGYIEYGYGSDDDRAKYINFNLGISDTFYDEQQKKYSERFEKIIEKKIENINNAKYNEKVMYELYNRRD